MRPGPHVIEARVTYVEDGCETSIRIGADALEFYMFTSEYNGDSHVVLPRAKALELYEALGKVLGVKG